MYEKQKPSRNDGFCFCMRHLQKVQFYGKIKYFTNVPLGMIIPKMGIYNLCLVQSFL